MTNKTYFISGSSKYDVKYFIRDYIPLIKQAVKSGANFVIGDCDGVDAMAQSDLNQILPEDQHSRVKVFFKGNNPCNYLSTNFVAIGGFISHEEAAVAMTLCSEEDIACLEEGFWNSLTAKNIMRRYTPSYNFKRWSEAKNRNVPFWEIVMGDKIEKKENEELPENFN